MPTARSLIAALAFAFTAVSCSDDKGPTAPTAPLDKAPTASAKPAPGTGTLSYTVVNANVVDEDDATLTGVFNGVVTITSFSTNAAGDLLASGTIVGNITGALAQPVEVTFIDQVVTTNRRCTILELDLGPLFLDLLGLEIDLSRIQLDITAVTGAGNLLGNLLCALVSLLDQNPLAAQVGLLLQQINAILAGLLG
jgi:hypothetical protein